MFDHARHVPNTHTVSLSYSAAADLKTFLSVSLLLWPMLTIHKNMHQMGGGIQYSCMLSAKCWTCAPMFNTAVMS